MAAEAGGAAAPASSSISEEEVSALLEPAAARGVREYDITAQRINRTQLPMLELIAKDFAQRAGASLGVLLSRDAGLEWNSLEPARALDVQASLPAPASVVVVRLKPLSGFAFVSVEPKLLLALLDAFFGGSGRVSGDSQAAVSPAAQRFLALLVRSWSADLAAAWAPVTPLELELIRQEVNPRLLALGSPQDSLLVLRFTAVFGAHSGRIDWLLPEGMIEPLREALSSEGGKAAAPAQEPWAPALCAALQEAEIETTAILAQAHISLRELVRLTPGDIIPIEPPQNVTLMAGGVALYRGRFGVSQGRNALKIIQGGSA